MKQYITYQISSEILEMNWAIKGNSCKKVVLKLLPGETDWEGENRRLMAMNEIASDYRAKQRPALWLAGIKN